MLKEEIMKKIKREPLMNGFLTRKVGEIAVVAMEKKECTQRVLEILYFDYFLKNRLNYMLVLFSDENFGYGVHIINGLVRTNVKIEKDKIGYSVMDTNDFKDYCPNEELTELSEVRFYEGKNPNAEFICWKCGKPKMIGYYTPKGKSMLTPCSCDCKKKS